MLNNIQKHVAIKSSLIDNTLLKYAFVNLSLLLLPQSTRFTVLDNRCKRNSLPFRDGIFSNYA